MFPDHASDGGEEALLVAILIFAVIEAESRLVQVAEKVEGLDRNVGAFDRPLQQRPKVFQTVGMDMGAHVAFRMVNDVVRVFVGKPPLMTAGRPCEPRHP